jgi:hypothetical protein
MTTIKQCSPGKIAVNVPGDAHGFKMAPKPDNWIIQYHINGHRDYIHLPPGTYSILAATDTTSEEEAAKVVERAISFGRVKRYKDYEFPDSAFYTALESLATYCTHYGLEGKYILLQQVK